MNITQVKQIIWNVQQLKHDMEEYRNAVATAVLINSPKHIVYQLKREYAEAKSKYDRYLELNVNIVEEGE